MTLKQLAAWYRERIPAESRSGAIRGPASVAYVFGWTLVMLVAVEAITGTALAAFYSPSTTDAWASLAYVQDQMAWGWLVRGLHAHASSAIVIVAGVHLVVTALRGGYRKPREVVWWLGLLVMVFVLGFAISGYVLRWDQAGYWANHVEVNIAASAPGGGLVKALALGGNDYGNLTLTRFYALHVVVLPAVCAVAALGHVWIARLHGTTRSRAGEPQSRQSRWPHQSLRDVVAMAIVFAIVLGYSISQHGIDLAAPADPAAAYDARPLWYFRWLFELRHLAGSYERFAALAAPVIVGGFLVGLPLIDRTPRVATSGGDATKAAATESDQAARMRRLCLAGLLGLVLVIGVLTMTSFARDVSDAALVARQDKADQRASRARALAAKNGVPVTGALDVFATVPMYRARTLFAQYCKNCHDADSKDRKGPIIGPGHGNRAWLKGFLADPSGDAYYGRTKLAKTDDAMKAVTMSQAQLDDLSELLYAESGASDVDAAKRDRGKALFQDACTDCHSLDEGSGGGSGPGLGGLGSRDHYTSYVSNPGRAAHMASMAEMPRFDRELSIIDRDALAGYLVWLRSATQQDVDLLGPL